MGGKRVVVVYDLGSATPLEIRSAAGRACEVEFVGDSSRPHVAAAADGIRRFAGFTDLAGLDSDGRLKAVEALVPDGVVTFSEYRLVETAEYAAALGLPGHSPETVVLLTDKLAQRRALAAVSPVRFAGIDDVDAAVAATGLPAVLKPRRGAGSAGTVRVDTVEELRAALPGGSAADHLLEQLLTGDPSVAGADWGDYVSVESVHTPAGSRQVCVTGKFPLDGFRETGMLLPATLSEADTEAVLSLDAAATAALGLRHGLTHTELKLTPEGPRVIEVNGRLGGYVPGILKQANGIDLVRVALQVALGLEPRWPAPSWTGVTYQYFLTPGEDGVLDRADGADELAALPGVRKVDLRARPGDRVERSAGTQAHLGVVHGTAPDHDTLARTARRIAEVFRPVFEGSSR
ncbi:ATP-grasp domain-containing protein [Amycolatopsis sp. CA-126428]|uniref:ATP-grasp domain-containing protein n=1 Tax=Amycolatopsis sp. CA-126428 TaxID=2073158 RepID=UPI000CD2885B|nr:ATP-grasp domain-containing protein [Amycolatopsis sp. CA-126428]